MSVSDDSKRAWKSFVKMRQPGQQELIVVDAGGGGGSGGHSVEDLLRYSLSSEVSYNHIPAIQVDVVGGILVYSKPRSYPEVNFTIQSSWKVAICVHSEHYDTLTVKKKTMILQQLLDHPKVVALGDCGLDRTINPSKWCRQEEVFVRLLKLLRIEQPPVLHFRGTKGDLYSSDVHGRYLMLMEDVCDPLQKIHVHCFMGRSDVVRTWLRKFPNTYFGVTVAVRVFDQKQLEGLQAILLNKLLLETDAPYFPLY
ncbi:LOW QUALITY PROTEIN: 3'-5' RNA nuclease TATDN2-like [Crassostrea virginica]